MKAEPQWEGLYMLSSISRHNPIDLKESTQIIFKQRDVSLVLLFPLKMTSLAVGKPDWKGKNLAAKREVA